MVKNSKFVKCKKLIFLVLNFKSILGYFKKLFPKKYYLDMIKPVNEVIMLK